MINSTSYYLRVVLTVSYTKCLVILRQTTLQEKDNVTMDNSSVSSLLQSYTSVFRVERNLTINVVKLFF